MPQDLIHVAFAGHSRPQDLGDPEEAVAGLSSAFALIAELGDAVLLTGLADGADRLAVQAWGDRPVHAIHPYLAAKTPPEAETQVTAATWLDGAALERGRRSPHLAQSRWLIEAADLLVVVWSGVRGRGAGGTADTVQLALRQQVPVLWVKPGATGQVRLIRPEHLDSDFGFLEFLEQLHDEEPPLVVPATMTELGRALARAALAPGQPERLNAPRIGPLDRWLGRTIWKTYSAFVRLVGGRLEPAGPSSQPPEDLKRQAGFQVLNAAYEEADAEADRLARIHRSQQILLLVLAILAAAIGSAPAVWPEFKIVAVLIELEIALAALAISLGATRSERHERWGEARRLAEQLRLERAAWALGLSTLPRLGGAPGPVRAGVRRVVRKAGLAAGVFDEERVRSWGAWAMHELIGGQADYHRRHGSLNGRVAHRIHRFETLSFGLFLLALAVFAVAYLAAEAVGHVLPDWLGGVVVMTSVIVPAVGAASIALEATLAFGEQGRRNQALAGRLAAIAAGLGESPRLDQLQQAAKAAIALEVVQEERWSDESFRRRLVRAG